MVRCLEQPNGPRGTNGIAPTKMNIWVVTLPVRASQQGLPMTSTSDATRRFAAAAETLGLPVAVIEHETSSRTAEEAAASCGCDVAQIVKSLVFRGRDTGRPILLLVSGKNRVNERATGTRIGEELERADANFVRDATGFAIGGIPPLGHREPMATFMDESLLEFVTVWAAAGTPNAVFSAVPDQIVEVTGAHVIRVT